MKETQTSEASRLWVPPELVAQAKAGDQAAFTELYELTSAGLYRTIHSMVRDEDLAWDIQQDSYLQAFHNLDRLEANGAFLSWLRRIAVNVTVKKMSQRRTLTFTELAGEEDEGEPEIPDLDPDAQPELALDRKETARLVREILSGLPESQQMILGMYYYEDMPIREIADTLHVSQGTVKSQLSFGRKKVEAGVRALEKQGVKLYGLSPLPFLLALLRRLEPAAGAEKKVLSAVLAEAPAAAGTSAVTVTALTAGQAFLKGLTVKLIAVAAAAALLVGGKLGYDALKRGTEPQIGTFQPTTETRDRQSADNPFVNVPEKEAEVNALLTAMIQAGVTDLSMLDEEYSLATLAFIYTKQHDPESIVLEQEETESYETLTLEQVNEVLERLLGQSVSPAEGTDYSEDEYSAPKHFRDGRFWWSVSDLSTLPFFAACSNGENPLTGVGEETVEFTVMAPNYNLYEQADWEDADLTKLTAEELALLAEAGKLQPAIIGRAVILWTDQGPQLRAYQLFLSSSAALQGQDILWRSMQTDPDGSVTEREFILNSDSSFRYREGSLGGGFSGWCSGTWRSEAEGLRLDYARTDETGTVISDGHSAVYTPTLSGVAPSSDTFQPFGGYETLLDMTFAEGDALGQEPSGWTVRYLTEDELSQETADLWAELVPLFDPEEPNSYWYRQALLNEFVRPEQLDLGTFFYNGMPEGDRRVLREEEAEALRVLGLDPQCGCVLTKSGIDKALETVLGLKLEDMLGVGMDRICQIPGSEDYFLSWEPYAVPEPDSETDPDNRLVIDKLLLNEDGSVTLDFAYLHDLSLGFTWAIFSRTTIVMVRDGAHWHIRSGTMSGLIKEDALGIELRAIFTAKQTECFRRALFSRFQNPADVDLYTLFCGGIPGVDNALTKEDRAVLNRNGWSDEELAHFDCQRLPRSEMDRVLTDCFGLTLEETAKHGLENFFYLPETDCWYCSQSEDEIPEIWFYETKQLSDGTILVSYELSYREPNDESEAGIWTVALEREGDSGFRILSNLPGEWVLAEDQSTLEALYRGTGAMKTETVRPDGSRVARELTIRADGSFFYREGPSDSDYTEWAAGNWWMEGIFFRFEEWPTDENGNQTGSGVVMAGTYECTVSDGELILIQQSGCGFVQNDWDGTELRFPLSTD